MPHFDKGDVLAAMQGRFGDFYSQWTALKLISGELRGPCPLHGGQGPNFAVSPETGVWHCFTQCGEGGDLFRFLEKKQGLSFPEALTEAAAFAGLTPLEEIAPARRTSAFVVRPAAPRPVPAIEPAAVFLNPVIAENLHENLMRSAKVQRWLLERRGLTEETLRRFQVGLLPARVPGNPQDYWRICFPVYDGQERLTNIRKHLFRYKDELNDDRRRHLGKTKSWQPGLRADLYPLSALSQAKAGAEGKRAALIVEGEADALLACQRGLAAITGTGGAGTWHERWTQEIAGLDRVTILYDADGTGEQGARKVAASVLRMVPDVRIACFGAWIPSSGGKG